MGERRLLFCSSIALYPPLLRVAELIAAHYRVEGHVIVPQDLPGASSSRTFWRCESKYIGSTSTPLVVHFLPVRKNNAERFGFDRPSLSRLLGELKPDYIWIHEEFWQGIAHQILWHYRFTRRPHIIAYVAINHATGPTPLLLARWPFLSRTRLKQRFLWSRLKGVAACATKSKECARRLGLPESVPIEVNFLPVFGPEEAGHEAMELPWGRPDSFIVGFAGFLSEQKGWKVLLQAVERLPSKFKVVLAGDGEQQGELLAWLERPGLQGLAWYAGFLAKEQLLATYPLCDVVVLPSITTADSVEQFGAVLAEAMACGVPVIGSDSGAIPETVGQAGIIFPEGNPEALAQTILRISEGQDLRRRLVAAGLERFRTYYSCETYAHSIANMLSLSHA